MKKIPKKIIDFAEKNDLTNISLNDFWCNPKLLFNDYFVYNVSFKKKPNFDWFILEKNNEIRFANQEEYEKLKEVYL